MVSERKSGAIYSSLEYLSDKDGLWRTYPGTETSHGVRDYEAMDLAAKLYHEWPAHILYMGSSVDSVDGLPKKIIETVKKTRLKQQSKKQKRKKEKKSNVVSV